MPTVRLTWEASSDDVAVASYRVYRNAVELAVVGAPALSYDDDTAEWNTTYIYGVEAIDTSGNVSVARATDSITLPDVDTVPPSAPGSLAGEPGHRSNRLTWAAATDNVGLQGYNVYRNGVRVGTLGPESLEFVDGGLSELTSYTYQVKALDSANEGAAATITVRTLSDQAVVYFATTGNDATGFGTVDSPFQTVTQANRHRISGQRVEFHHGQVHTGTLKPRQGMSYGVWGYGASTPQATIRASAGANAIEPQGPGALVEYLDAEALGGGCSIRSGSTGTGIQRFTYRRGRLHSDSLHGAQAQHLQDADWHIGPGVTVDAPNGHGFDLAGSGHVVGYGDVGTTNRDNVTISCGAWAVITAAAVACHVHDVTVSSSADAFWHGRSTMAEELNVDASSIAAGHYVHLWANPVGATGKSVLRRELVENAAAGVIVHARAFGGGLGPPEDVAIGKATIEHAAGTVLYRFLDGLGSLTVVDVAHAGTGGSVELSTPFSGAQWVIDYNAWQGAPTVVLDTITRTYDQFKIDTGNGQNDAPIGPLGFGGGWVPAQGSVLIDTGTQRLSDLGAVTFLWDGPDIGDKEAQPIAPPQPAQPTCLDVEVDAISVAWLSVPTTDEYEVYLNDVIVSTTSSTSIRIGGLVPGTPYNVRVAAINEVGGSLLSPARTCTTDLPEPPPLGNQPMHTGPLEFLELVGETGTAIEVGNGARVLAYVRNGLANQARLSAAEGCLCGVLERELGFVPTSPAADPAPWYDPRRPESAEFLGFYPYRIEGLRSSSETRTVYDRTTGLGGGTLGPAKTRARTFTVKGRLVANSSAAMEYGRQWLKGVLQQGGCAPCATKIARLRTACPSEDGSRDDVGEAILYDVGVLDWDEPDYPAVCGLEDWTITLAAGKGDIYRQPRLIVPTTGLNLGTGGCVDFRDWFCGTERSFRQVCGAVESPLFGTVCAIVTVEASDGDITAPVVISAYPPGSGCPPPVEIAPTARITIPTLPNGSALVVDSARHQIVYIDPNGDQHDGTPYVQLEAERGIPWIEAEPCRPAACVCVGSLRLCGASASVTIETQVRER